MEQPFFTVIIPTYNRAELIRRPIESVIAQTFDSWELIIVDDGSTDNTEQVVKSYQDARIRYIFQQNLERSAARNTGIKNSRGRYICFLDSDDYYLPDHLASFHQKIVSEHLPVAVLYCDTYEDCDGKLILHKTTPIQARNDVERAVQMIIGIPRTCVHRQIFDKHLFDPAITVGEDVELWSRALKDYPLIFNDAATVVFVTHGGRTVHIGNVKSFKAHLALTEKNHRGRQGRIYFFSGSKKDAVLCLVPVGEAL